MQELGKVPPHDKRLESKIIGGLITTEGLFTEKYKTLNRDLFYDNKNVEIFEAMESLYKRDLSVDIVSVFTEVKKKNTDPEMTLYLMKTTEGIVSTKGFDTWVLLLKELYVKRQLKRIAQKTVFDSEDEGKNGLDLLAETETKITELSNLSVADNRTFEDVLKETLRRIKIAAEGKEGIGIKTGFRFIDSPMTGLVAPDVTVLAGEPGGGKSTLALNLLENIARQGKSVGIISYEMSEEQLTWKIISRNIKVPIVRIRSGNLSDGEWDQFGELYEEIKHLPISISEDFLSPEKIKSVASEWKAKHGLSVLIIDYLQLVPGDKDKRFSNRESLVSYNSRRIKEIAKTLNISIILLSQMNRNGAKEEEPELSSLRESGGIEQNADNVVFIKQNRQMTEEYYGFYPEDDRPEWVVDLFVKKCRLGSRGLFHMTFSGENNSFIENL